METSLETALETALETPLVDHPCEGARVAVLGAGLAGSLLALALARRGVAAALVGPASPAASELSYGGMAGRSGARQWRELERWHGPLGWRPSRLLLHGWPAPLHRLPPSLQALATAALPFSRVDAVALAAALPAALAAAGVERLEGPVRRIEAAAAGWRLDLGQGLGPAVPQVVLAAGAGCRALWPALPERLRFSWAGVIAVEPDAMDLAGPCPWLAEARLGRIVQARQWQRPALEARAGTLTEAAWIVDAGLAPWGERVLLGQISLVEPGADPGQPPDPALMEARLREGLCSLAPRIAALPGRYRQVAVPFCLDGQPLAGPVAGTTGLWAFTGFSGAFSVVPALAETLAETLAEALAAGSPAQLA
jgi:glycine/D-amino acid oxidase-like deaminating enzyme